MPVYFLNEKEKLKIPKLDMKKAIKTVDISMKIEK